MSNQNTDGLGYDLCIRVWETLIMTVLTSTWPWWTESNRTSSEVCDHLCGCPWQYCHDFHVIDWNNIPELYSSGNISLQVTFLQLDSTCAPETHTHTHTHTHTSCMLVVMEITQVRHWAINVSYPFPHSYYVGMCGDGANDCGVSRNYFF